MANSYPRPLTHAIYDYGESYKMIDFHAKLRKSIALFIAQEMDMDLHHNYCHPDRCYQSLDKGISDFSILTLSGLAKNAEEFHVFPFSQGKLEAYTLKTHPLELTNKYQLEGMSVGLFSGVRYESLLKNVELKPFSVSSTERMIMMLQAGRIDVALDFPYSQSTFDEHMEILKKHYFQYGNWELALVVLSVDSPNYSKIKSRLPDIIEKLTNGGAMQAMCDDLGIVCSDYVTGKAKLPAKTEN